MTTGERPIRISACVLLLPRTLNRSEGLQVSNHGETTPARPLRVAIVGAGPAGVYAADIL
ncbi:MAG: fprA1, partial [Pseudarthrobacter sp.]|nr:fprA1 [Pseudarthrobacter sp.]